MNIKIVTDGFSLTEAISEYVHKKFSVITKHLNQDSNQTLVDVMLRDNTKHKKGGFHVQVNIPVRGGMINSTEEGDDLYAIIDIVKDELVRELEKYNTKHRDVSRQSASDIKKKLKGL